MPVLPVLPVLVDEQRCAEKHQPGGPPSAHEGRHFPRRPVAELRRKDCSAHEQKTCRRDQDIPGPGGNKEHQEQPCAGDKEQPGHHDTRIKPHDVPGAEQARSPEDKPEQSPEDASPRLLHQSVVELDASSDGNKRPEDRGPSDPQNMEACQEHGSTDEYQESRKPETAYRDRVHGGSSSL
jgi:hypothetical protein